LSTCPSGSVPSIPLADCAAMAPGLRNEDYVAFLDESGEPGLQVVAGVLVPARWLRSAERRWRDFIRDHLGSRSGRTEVKGRDLISGNGVSLHAQNRILASGGAAVSARAAGRLFYRDALEHVGSLTEVRILTVGLSTDRPLEVYRLWFWMAYAALIERPRAPRPRLPLVVIDGEDAAFRAAQDLVAYRFYRAFARRQPYIGRGIQWFVGGSVHQDSQLHPFVQMADLVAGAGRHAIAGRIPQGTWYKPRLQDHAKSMGREVDISRHALRQLRTLAPRDRCRSGWRRARLVPDAVPRSGRR
jgi:hypothetical protein